MPECLCLERALSQISAVVSQFPSFRVLTDEELAYYKGHRFAYGWEIAGLCDPHHYALRVLATQHLPFSPPRIAVTPPPQVLEWPHLEEHGILCLLAPADTHDPNDLSSVTISLLNDAVRLVGASCSGENRADFEEEFLSYWQRWDNSKLDFVSLCDPSGPSRQVLVWHTKSGVSYVADNKAELVQWIQHAIGKLPSPFEPIEAPLLWLNRPPVPDRFPKTMGDLYDLIGEDEEASNLLAQHLLRNQKGKTVVLGIRGKHGASFAGFRAERPMNLMNGFRSAPPPEIYWQRFAPAPLTAANVRRADHSWVHGRDQDPQSMKLAQMTVLLLGIGSIGSEVAEMLARAGIGHLILVDPEKMETENASRHALGIDSARYNKATTLASSLRTRYPHLSIDSAAVNAESYLAERPASHPAPDLIISSIGNWQAESFISNFQRTTHGCPSVLFAWLEPHAAAGHAIVVGRDKGCLLCLMDETGRMRMPVTVWSATTLSQVPACGGVFQPYGVADATLMSSIAAGLAIEVLMDGVTLPFHRAWVGQRRIIDANGGAWNPEWEALHGAVGAGGCIIEPAFAICPSCPICLEK